jgi:hypothetical protein
VAAEGPGLLAGPALVGVQHQLEIGAPIEQQPDQRQLVAHGVAGYLQLGLEGVSCSHCFQFLSSSWGALDQRIGPGGHLLGQHDGRSRARTAPRAAVASGLSPRQLRQTGEGFGLGLGQGLGKSRQGGSPPAIVDAYQQALARHLQLTVKGQGWVKAVGSDRGECHQGFRLYLEKSGRRFSLNALRPS